MATRKVVQQLITELTADGAKMKKELDKSYKDARTWGDKVTSVAKKASIGLAAGAGTVAVGLGALIKSTISSGREIQNLSALAGINAQEFQRLAFASQGFGVQQEKLADILKDTSDKVGDFLQNGAGPLADFFENVAPLVGVTADEFRNLSGREALQLYTSSLEKANLSQSEMTFYMEAIASDATLLLPLLRNNGAELDRLSKKADSLGNVLSDVDLLALADADQAFLEFEATLDGLGKKIAVDLLPNVQKLTDLLNDPNTRDGLSAIAKGLVYIADGGVNATSELGLLGDQIAANVANMTGQLQDIDKLKIEIRDIDRALRGGLSTPLGYIFTSKAELETLRAEKALLLEIAEGGNLAAPDAAQITKPETTPKLDTASIRQELDFMKLIGEEAKKMGDERKKAQQQINGLYQSEVESLHRMMTLKSDASELDRVQYELEHGRLQGLDAKQKESLQSMAEELDLHNEIAAAVAERAATHVELAGIEDLLRTEVERVNSAWDARIKIINEAGLSEARTAELIAKAEARRADDIKKLNEESMDAMSEYSRQAARNMQSAFADFLFDPFEDGLDGMLKSFGKILQRMAAEMAAAQLFNGLAGWGEANAGKGGWAGALGGIASMFGGAYAEGGRPPVGKISVVGDGGEPELFVPDTAGTIIPFSQLQGGGGSTTIGNVNMSFPGITNAREAEMAAGAAARKLAGMAGGSRRYT